MFRSFVHNKTVAIATHLSLISPFSNGTSKSIPSRVTLGPYCVKPFCIAAITVLASHISTASAEVIYDNTNLQLTGGERLFPEFGPFQALVAQPFNIGVQDNISSFSINMSRVGSPQGTVQFSIWDDSGSGIPGQQIAELGLVDLSELEDVGRQASSLPIMTFDTSVEGLIPNDTYYVVLNEHIEVGGTASNTFLKGALISREGATEVGELLLEDPPGSANWLPSRIIFGRPRYLQMSVSAATSTVLHAGDADQDLDFDQTDLVQVQVAAKYLTGQAATWGEGDWDGAPGGSPSSPPAGDGLFNQTDIIAAQMGDIYLTGPYAAVQANGTTGDGQTSVIYNAGTGEVAVDAPAGVELTSINIDSASGIFTGEDAANLGGSFDNDADNNVFKATFGSSFGSLSFGNVAQAGLSEEFMLGDLTVIGSLAGGGDLGDVDLVYVPEPASALLLAVGLVIGLLHFTRANR